MLTEWMMRDECELLQPLSFHACVHFTIIFHSVFYVFAMFCDEFEKINKSVGRRRFVPFFLALPEKAERMIFVL